MKSLLIVLFGSYLLFIFGIASAAEYKLDVRYGESADTGYYVIVGKSNDKWVIKEIFNKATKRKNDNEEVLFVNEGIDYIQPSFEEDDSWKYRGKYEGGFAFKCAVGSGKNKQKYTPCNSELTKFSRTDFFFLAGGTTYVLMEERLSALVKETALISKLKDFQKKMRDEALGVSEHNNERDMANRARSRSGIKPDVSTSFENEPEGFRGIKWGQSPDDVRDFVDGPNVMENVTQAVYFQRIWSDNKIGNAYLKELLYCFWKDKFWKVTGRTKSLGDTTNFTRLKEAFFGQFGKPTREIKNERRGAWTADVYIWDGNVSQIELHHLKSIGDSGNYGFFEIQSVEIEKERGKPKGLGF